MGIPPEPQNGSNLQGTNGAAMRNVMQMAVCVAQKKTLADMDEAERSIQAYFKNPSMPSISSQADAMVKIASVAPEFYDGLREMALGSALGAVAESGWEPEAEDAAVRAMIQGFVDGGSAADFIAQLIDRADSEVRRSANESVARNARRDKAKVGYARVPSGVETCKWCIAIAANGPSFKSMEIASHSHPNCDCRVVPDFGDGIQGYDPDYYYDVYKHPENHPEYQEARNARRRELYAEKRDSVLGKIHIGRSVGAKARNFTVMVDGKESRFIEDSEIGLFGGFCGRDSGIGPAQRAKTTIWN